MNDSEAEISPLNLLPTLRKSNLLRKYQCDRCEFKFMLRKIVWHEGEYLCERCLALDLSREI